MKTADIEAVLKKTGGHLLKDANPELYQLELNQGATVQFFKAYPTAQGTPSEPAAGTASSDAERAEAPEMRHEGQGVEACPTPTQDEDQDWPEDDVEEEGAEHCPVCGAQSNWGSTETCEHFIGMIFDSSILDCDVLNSLHEAWTDLDQLEAHYSEVLLWAIARRRNVGFKSFSFYLRNRDVLTGDLSSAYLFEIARGLFGLHIGRRVRQC